MHRGAGQAGYAGKYQWTATRKRGEIKCKKINPPEINKHYTSTYILCDYIDKWTKQRRISRKEGMGKRRREGRSDQKNR